MNSWLEALPAAEAALSERKGDFALFSCLLPADSGDQWDLVVSAPWARRDDQEVLTTISGMISETVTSDDRLLLARIVIVETWHRDVQELNSRVEVEHGWTELRNEEHFGYLAQRAIIITSRDAWGYLKRLFPAGTEFVFFTRDGDLYIRISWRLNDDPQRPNKRSRNIILAISRESLDDYLYLDDPRRYEAEQKLAAYVAHRLRVFNPRHDSPRYAEPPREEWRVTTALFRDAVAHA